MQVRRLLMCASPSSPAAAAEDHPRDRKIRCDRKQPCSHCVKATARECTYVSTHTQPPPSRRTRSSSKPSVRPAIPEMDRPSYALMPVRSSPSTAPASTPASASDPPGVERLLARVHELEDQLSRSVSLDLDHAAVDQRRPHGRLPSRSNAYMSKTRYFSESHWMSLAELVRVWCPQASRRTGCGLRPVPGALLMRV